MGKDKKPKENLETSDVVVSGVLIQYGQVDENGNIFVEGCFDEFLKKMRETIIITENDCLGPNKIENVEDFILNRTRLNKERLRTSSLILGYHNNQLVVLKNRGSSIKINDQVFSGGVGTILNIESKL